MLNVCSVGMHFVHTVDILIVNTVLVMHTSFYFRYKQPVVVHAVDMLFIHTSNAYFLFLF